MDVSGEQLPRIFQVNLIRLFDHVIKPGMDALPVHVSLQHGVADSLAEVLDRAKAQVENYTANEAAKSFTLTVAAVFERQLSIFFRGMRLIAISKSPRYEEYLDACAKAAGVDLGREKLGVILGELLLVGNVVRHGEGSSCDKLRAVAPALWDSSSGDYFDALPGPSLPSEHLRIRKKDLVNYIRATALFWGLADKQPGAVIDLPYGAP